MNTEHHPTPQNAGDGASPKVNDASVKAGHEVTDVSVKGLTLSGVGLVAAVLGVFAVLFVVFRIFGAVDTRLDQEIARHETGAASRVHVRPEYAGPELQVVPEKDLAVLRDENRAALAGYGWIDRNRGVVRLPIERAITIIAQRGIPSTSPGQTVEEIQQQRAQLQVYGQVLRP